MYMQSVFVQIANAMYIHVDKYTCIYMFLNER